MDILVIVFWVCVLGMLIYILYDGIQTKQVSFWNILVLLAFVFLGAIVTRVGKPDSNPRAELKFDKTISSVIQ
jgi:hypothetical protein